MYYKKHKPPFNKQTACAFVFKYRKKDRNQIDFYL